MASSLVLNAAQQAIVDYVRANPTRSCMCHGAAGTGKSVIVQALLDVLEHVVILGPTGKSIVHIESAETIAKYIGASYNTVGVPSLLINNPRQTMLTAHTIIIDECGMISAGEFVALDQILRKQRCVPQLPFGGVRLILVGDVYQLQPVDDFFFMTDTWRELEHCQAPFKVFQLEKNERLAQTDNEANYDMMLLLDALRYGTFSPMSYAFGLINHTLVPRQAPALNDARCIVLCATHTVAAAINTECLEACTGAEYTFKCKNKQTTFKKRARVQVTRNIYADKILMACNGATGTIQEMAPVRDATVIKPINTLSKTAAWTCTLLLDETETTVSIPSCAERVQGHTLTEMFACPSAKHTYAFPLRIAYAVTIHCMQGQTISRGIIDGTAMFAGRAQLYTAFSRFSDINQIYLRHLDAYQIVSMIEKTPPHAGLEAFIAKYALK